MTQAKITQYSMGQEWHLGPVLWTLTDADNYI